MARSHQMSAEHHSLQHDGYEADELEPALDLHVRRLPVP